MPKYYIDESNHSITTIEAYFYITWTYTGKFFSIEAGTNGATVTEIEHSQKELTQTEFNELFQFVFKPKGYVIAEKLKELGL